MDSNFDSKEEEQFRLLQLTLKILYYLSRSYAKPVPVVKFKPYEYEPAERPLVNPYIQYATFRVTPFSGIVTYNQSMGKSIGNDQSRRDDTTPLDTNETHQN